VFTTEKKQYIIHEINKSKGNRIDLQRPGKRHYLKITDIPAIKAHQISVKLPHPPKRVMIQPGHISLQDWKYENGRLNISIPAFHIHQMIVIES
jgi:hypothetical protein